MLQNENNTLNGTELIEKNGIQLLSFPFVLQYVQISHLVSVTFAQITAAAGSKQNLISTGDLGIIS